MPAPIVLIAQISPFGPQPNIPPLPPPPLLTSLLLEHPAPLVGALGIAAVVAFAILNARGRARQAGIAGLALLLAAAGLYTLATLIQTDREKISEETKALIGAAAHADSRALDAQMAPTCRLYTSLPIPEFTVPSDGLGKAAILDGVVKAMGQQHHVDEAAVLELQAAIDGPTSGRTQVRVRTTIDKVPVFSWWRITWQRGSDGDWKAAAIEPLHLGF